MFTVELKDMPRSTTREQWREANRWRRLMTRTLRDNGLSLRLVQSLRDLVVYGSAVI